MSDERDHALKRMLTRPLRRPLRRWIAVAAGMGLATIVHAPLAIILPPTEQLPGPAPFIAVAIGIAAAVIIDHRLRKSL
ncbi:MAG: hypothetical protein AAF968_09010 [Pseudomonadota bacterium]